MPEKHFTRSDAYRRGVSDSKIRTDLRSGELTRVRHGALITTEEWAALGAREQYVVRVRAAALRGTSDAAVSHQSAAALYELPLLKPDYTTLHFSIHGNGGGYRGARVLHRVCLDPLDVTIVDGLRVTTLARTAIDSACMGTFDQAVCVIESALRIGATKDELHDVSLRLGKRKGIALARRATAYADGATESIGESWSRARMAAWPDIPMPRLQNVFRSPSGLIVARTDFDWEGLLVGEMDGRVKYKGGTTDAIIRERQRENALQAMGVHVVRWTWDELRRPEQLYRLLRAGLDRVGIH